MPEQHPRTARRQITWGVAYLAMAAVITALIILAAVQLSRRAFAAPAPQTILVGSAYERAAVFCRGTTKSGSRCRRLTTNAEVYCFQHTHQAPQPQAVVNLTPGR